MFCPKCAAPIEGVKFCRGCGTNVSLVPQAISGRIGELTVQETGHPPERRRKAASVERAASSFFTGIGFVLVSLAIMVFQSGGSNWWFWMLIPGFACIGSGVGQYLRVKSDRERLLPQPVSYVIPQVVSPAAVPQLDQPNATTTSNLGSAQQGSVTEDTTRHLG